MSDLPPGHWSPLLVGHQWPSSESVNRLEAAAASRALAVREFERYAEQLQSARAGPLVDQKGITADDARQAFQLGERSAVELSVKNRTKSDAYRNAQNLTTSLRDDLRNIAQEGNLEIETVQAADELQVKKVAAITEIVIRSQIQANSSAAYHCGSVLSVIQGVLDDDDAGGSAQAFARANGTDLDRAFGSTSREGIGQQVEAKLDQLKQSPKSLNGSSQNFLASGNDQVPSSATPITSSTAGDSSPRFIESASDSVKQLPTPAADQLVSSAPSNFAAAGSDKAIAGNSPALSPIPAQPSTSATASTGSLSPGAGQPASRVTVTTPNIPTSAPALSPESLANNFTAGANAGAPVSAGTEALSTNTAHAIQAQAPVPSQPSPPAPIAATSGTPLFETAHVVHTFVDTTAQPTPMSEAPQPVIAAPAASPPPPPIASAPSPAAPVGPLPAYGADLRPVAATAPASPPPPMAAPGSAPVSSGTNAMNQPAVVRQQTPLAPNASAAGLTETAVAATATGTAAGATTAHSQAQRRLQRLLDSVTRQEPKLHWMIGNREDGSTVLATDLAGGWIPPTVEIPIGVTLLAPGRRSGPLAVMLGQTALTATYSPGEYIAPADNDQPVSTSIRARRTTDVDELDWELARTTKWRDGLPRLAHTLAKAASSGTGYLDSEIDLLHGHLQTVAKRALSDYPGNVDTATVGNWQLLASIDALTRNERICANYHLAWFQALILAPKGEVGR